MSTTPSLAAIKRAVQPGQVYTLTNHYISDPAHPAYRSRPVTVEAVNTTSVTWRETDGRRTRTAWPKADQVQRDPNGVIRLYGQGVSQQPTDLFITLTPEQPAS